MYVNRQDIMVALGANLGLPNGGPAATLALAIAELARSGFDIRRISRFYSTPCFPAGAGPDYVNAALVIRAQLSTANTQITPADVMQRLHDIEQAFGRVRKERWGTRTLDLDLLGIGDIVLPDAAIQAEWRALPPDRQTRIAPDQLVLPHPRLQDRAFVLVPLADVAAHWMHPTLGHTVAQLCDALEPATRAEVVPL